MAGRLNDNEVAQEMNKMVAFIKQEALEKARELKVKADEEFNIEKAKIVRQETVAIEAFYQKKHKQAEVQRKIAQSNHINKCRLRVLQARQQVLNELLSDAKSQLTSISNDRSKYEQLLHDLLLQGFYKLMEKDLQISCRQKDADIVRSAIKAAADTYKQKIGGQVNAVIDESAWLPESGAGGVVVNAQEGRIRVSNTLESRLDLLSEHMLPDIRILLFGPSLTRKFYN
ncbi:ATPase, V1/A1 complex, subunit E [Fimicolochytrium jonesii]|uniref:ATPase, V1/A1 complex, subunit E n=1 Tax=Fimicolochytrium jonesii TaxID=1396493 RepID=UPI0022FEB38F|nr:ATPase, V1/A1 complex, subunit E [Fimicolochytrium jonesii]KAI8816010.1 ATPase, V1/A1 complex, subunit E [Fimicolochytrium jonesii]